VTNPGYSELGNLLLDIIVSDSGSTQNNPFTLTIKNDPPVFIYPPPVRIEASVGIQNKYLLPKFADPEG